MDESKGCQQQGPVYPPVARIAQNQSMSALMANWTARRRGTPIPFAAPIMPVRNDVGWPWRIDWGGHDPATPLAEMHINYHNTAWATMIFVCGTVVYLMRGR